MFFRNQTDKILGTRKCGEVDQTCFVMFVNCGKIDIFRQIFCISLLTFYDIEHNFPLVLVSSKQASQNSNMVYYIHTTTFVCHE